MKMDNLKLTKGYFLFLTVRLMKAILIENLEQKYFFKEISCLGEILEGALYYSANYGDSGIKFNKVN